LVSSSLSGAPSVAAPPPATEAPEARADPAATAAESRCSEVRPTTDEVPPTEVVVAQPDEFDIEVKIDLNDDGIFEVALHLT
jgi:hypothetical protein